MAAAATAALFSMAAMEAAAAPPPASAFGRIPAVVDAAISPNGQRVAILGGMSDQRVISIATIDQQGLPVLPLGEVETMSVRWVGDGFVLARIAYWETTGPRANYRFERNIAVTPDAKPASRLLDNDLLSMYSTSQPVLGIAQSGSRAMVLGLANNGGAAGSEDTRIKRKGESGTVWALWRVDPANGNGQLVERGNNDTISWEVDLAGQPRVRLDVDELNHRFAVFGKPGGKGSWVPVWSGGSYESRRHYYGYSEPDDAIYLAEGGRLVKKPLAGGPGEPLGQATSFNPRLIWDEHRNTVVGIASGGERPTYEWLDPEIGAAAGVLVRAFKAQHVQLYGWSADRTRFLARVAGPASPGVWYLYDRPRKEVSPMGEEYPELKGAPLGTTKWITYKARDGMEIPAYVTMPPGAQPGAKVPLIVYPHGGPTSRDDFDFDYVVQFLATRGYAVLQPQFRGSWGFGDAFEQAGKGEWGGKMQTDLQDGVAALAATGDIDPKRVCVVGGSFGGYSALAGAALYPDAYRCAASIAGISDLGLLIVERGRTYGREGAATDELRADLGAASTEKLMAHSPARHAGAVKAPLLLIHGDKDTVVPIEQSKRMAELLKAAGKPHEFIVLEGENHYLTKSANRIRTLEALEQFLAKNLPVN